MYLSISLLVAAAVVSVLSVWITAKSADLTKKAVAANIILTTLALIILMLSIAQLNAQENEKLRDKARADLDRAQAARDRIQAVMDKQHQHEIDSITFSRIDTSYQLALGIAGWSRVMDSSIEMVRRKSDSVFNSMQERFNDNIARQEQLILHARRIQFPLDDNINVSFKLNFKDVMDSALRERRVTSQTDLLHPTPMDTAFIPNLADIRASLKAVTGQWVLLISFFEPGNDSACLQLRCNINVEHIESDGSASLYYNNPDFALHLRNIPCTIVWNKTISSLLDLSNKEVRLTVNCINEKYDFKRTEKRQENIIILTHEGMLVRNTFSYSGYIADFSIGTKKLRSYDYKPIVIDSVDYIPQLQFPAF